VRFVDECWVKVQAGDGGDGCVAFRREKYVALGGPSGGDGGRGGDVVFVADAGLATLHDIQHLHVVRAASGGAGEGKDRYGRAGQDVEIRVPLGTVVCDADTRCRLWELTREGDRVVVARGGRGGRGNKRFATPTDRAPRRADPGEAGESRSLRLELLVMADVGLVGFPNVGKSTLVRAVSRARPKVADYPFTTLRPHLGVVTIGDTRRGLGQSFVLADIPGLVPKASEGAGLGTQFLKHLARTRVLLHLVTFTGEPGRSPLTDYRTIRQELTSFSAELARRAEVVAMTKADLPEVRDAYQQASREFAAAGLQLRLISAATHAGLDDLMHELGEKLFL
jgi:GTP-binding protein